MQMPFDFPLTDFEKATLWQLTGGDCKGMINRKHKGLKPYA